MKPNDASIRKRTQINKANRTMFLWIAAASAIVGAALVVSIFLSQKLIYNEKVLAAKQETVTRLTHNNAVVDDLKAEARVRDTDPALSALKASDTDQPLQVVLDALPSEANSLALGASLQNKLLAGINGLSLETIQVDPVAGIEVLTGDDESLVATTADGTGDTNTIHFHFSVSGPDAALKQVLQNLERSIRTIQVTSLKIETVADKPVMTVDGIAYYEPAKNIALKSQVVPR